MSFDDPIRIALPDYPNADAAGRVTIRHLLAHTSGLPDFYRNGKYRQFRSELRTLRDYWKTFAYDELEFDPGSRWSYSNSNYMLLRTIVESVSGRSFSDYVRDEVFARAGMQSSGYVSGGPRAARSYSRFTAGMGPSRRSDPQRWHTVPVEPGSGGGPAGGGVSTAEDLGRFGAALLAGTIVPGSIVDEMMTAQAEMEGGGQAGLGLHIHDWSGTMIIGHGGRRGASRTRSTSIPMVVTWSWFCRMWIRAARKRPRIAPVSCFAQVVGSESAVAGRTEPMWI